MTDIAGQTEPTEAEVSLRDQLGAAFDADQGAGPADAGQPLAIPAAPAADQAAAQRARDDAGRFAKTPEQAQGKPVEPVTPQAGGEPLKEAIAPPASWSAAAKAKFATLDPDVQQEVLKREKDVTDGLAQRQQKDERFNRLDSLLAPRRERFQLAGIDEFQAVQALFAAQDYLERQPVDAIVYLARQYGVDLRQFSQGAPGQAAQPQIHPVLQQVLSKVQSLESAQAQAQTQAQQAVQSQYVSEVQTFRTDPKNIYFDNVQQDMVALLQSGRARTLQDAYDQAVWANPETRPLMLRAQQDQAEADRRLAATQKAGQARHASGSITGSPTPGSSPANAGPAPTLRDELAAQFAAAS